MFNCNLLRSIREKKGIRQEDVAKRAGVLVNTYWLWEKGQSDPSVSKLERVAIVLGCKVDDFLDGKDKEGKEILPPSRSVDSFFTPEDYEEALNGTSE